MKRVCRLSWLSLLVLAACSGISVRTSYDPQAVSTFAGYQTYAWLPQPEVEGDTRVSNPIFESMVKRAVDGELAKKGFRLVEEDQRPSFKVGWYGAIESKVDVSTVDPYYGWSPWVGPGPWYPETYVREYEQGTLVLNIADGESNKLVWRGSAQAELSPAASPERQQRRIQEAVEKMLAKFPPRPK